MDLRDAVSIAADLFPPRHPVGEGKATAFHGALALYYGAILGWGVYATLRHFSWHRTGKVSLYALGLWFHAVSTQRHYDDWRRNGNGRG